MIKRGKPHIFSRFLMQPPPKRTFEPALLCIAVLLFFFISSCFNAEARPSPLVQDGGAGDAQHSSLSVTSLLMPSAADRDSAHHIALFLGYGFSDAEKKDALFDYLSRTYGFKDEGGLISVLSYPEDVSAAGRIRMPVLTAKLKELHTQKALTAFITAGSPQGMHTVLAALQDADMDVPVFSLFSQDEVLGTEAGSALVFDYRPAPLKGTQAAEAAAHKEDDYEYRGRAEDVLDPLIRAALHWQTLKDDPMLIPALRTEFFRQTGCSLVIYTDPVTGLRAKNHYVLTDVSKDSR
ncbi:hypothetical protein V1L52_02430 [Treponema sp. HNW]|uniref:hypothetical protein n=1 Tax=Treponema sp. HNW TaxID=3116654 RepID=UPI003D0F8F0D